jgi:hypothetical protein
MQHQEQWWEQLGQQSCWMNFLHLLEPWQGAG